MLPNYLHIGASKCKSSWLWKVCLEHPEIYVPTLPDNVNFFTVHYQRGLDWYEQTYFADYAGEPVCGEFSNSYMAFEPAMQRLARDLPDVKLTATLRNPIDRGFLSWAHIHLKKKLGLDPDKGIGIPLERILHHHGHTFFRAFFDPSFYAHKLQRLYTYVPKERVLVMLYDDLMVDQKSWLQRYFTFLGVDPDFEPTADVREINPDPTAALLPPAMRAELTEVFREDILQLQDLLDRDLSAWLTGEYQGYTDNFLPPPSSP